jgi:hypothetical protein
MNHLEYLKRGFEESQKRFQEGQREFGAAQVKYNAIAQEFNAWQTLYQAAKRKENGDSSIPATQAPKGVEKKQTEAVREFLDQHPGATPAEIWKQLQSQIANRAYLYSVLKRLRDRGDAMERKGKYFLKPKPEEAKATIQ